MVSNREKEPKKTSKANEGRVESLAVQVSSCTAVDHYYVLSKVVDTAFRFANLTLRQNCQGRFMIQSSVSASDDVKKDKDLNLYQTNSFERHGLNNGHDNES